MSLERTEGPERPILWLGLAGFDGTQVASIAAAAAASNHLVHWRVCAFQDADAWLLNGARVSTPSHDQIRVAAGMPTERAVRLALADVNRPLSFASPLPADISALSEFDLGDPGSLGRVLEHFTTWLRPRRAQFHLGSQIVGRQGSVRRSVYHLLHANQLVAVLDFLTGRAAFAPDASVNAIAGAEWCTRPPSAGVAPAGFAITSIAQLSWTYVRHSERQLLPDRYWTRPISFRTPPKVPIDWISDTQLVLLREVHARALTLEQLQRETGFVLEQITRDLACLYFAGAITCHIAPSPVHGPAPSDSFMRSSSLRDEPLDVATESFDANSLDVVPDGLTRQYRTVPAPLLWTAAANGSESRAIA